MKSPRIFVPLAVIVTAIIAAAGAFAASPAASDLKVAIPRVGGSCAANNLPRMKAAVAATNPSSKKLSAAKPDAAGPIVPAEGPDGLKWLCREDEEAQQCVCIPFVQ
jgi:hypothetical protein